MDATLYTGRDILAAENYIRCATVADALAAVKNDMPEQVVVRLADFVGADRSDPFDIVRRAKLPRSAR
jgi:hypothetical protein